MEKLIYLIFCIVIFPCFLGACEKVEQSNGTVDITVTPKDISFAIDPDELNIIENWNELVDSVKSEYLDKQYYFGYIVRDCALLYAFTGLEKYKITTLDVVNYISAHYTQGGFLNTPLSLNVNWERDFFARTLRLYYEAYTYTHEKSILDIIETQVDLWISHVPRLTHNGFKIFPYGITPPPPPICH